MIPQAAVEAAAKAHYEIGLGAWEGAHRDTRAVEIEDMRIALEAAAPHLHAACGRGDFGQHHDDAAITATPNPTKEHTMHEHDDRKLSVLTAPATGPKTPQRIGQVSDVIDFPARITKSTPNDQLEQLRTMKVSHMLAAVIRHVGPLSFTADDLTNEGGRTEVIYDRKENEWVIKLQETR